MLSAAPGDFPAFGRGLSLRLDGASHSVIGAEISPLSGGGLSLRHQRRNLNRLDGLISPPLGGDFH